MITSPLTVTPINGTSYRSTPSSGTGKVQVANDKAYLVTGSETIPIPATAAATFSDGERVRYVIDKNILVLMPAEENGKPPASIADILQISPSIAETGRPLLRQLIAQVPNQPPGMYLFTDVNQLLDFIGQKENPEFAALIKLLKNINPIIGVSVLPSDGPVSNAVIIPVASSSAAITSLMNSFSSRFMQTLTEHTVQQILDAEGMLDTVKLAELDNECSIRNIPPLSTRAGSPFSQEAAQQQWLTSILRLPSGEIGATLAPATTSTRLLNDILRIPDFSLPDAGVSDVSGVSLSEQSIRNLPKDGNFLRETFTRFGFNLENQLQQQLPIDGRQQDGYLMSIKSELLKLSADAAISPQAPDTTHSPNSGTPESGAAMRTAYQTLHQMRQIVSELVSSAPESFATAHPIPSGESKVREFLLASGIQLLEKHFSSITATLLPSHPATRSIQQAENIFKSTIPLLENFIATRVQTSTTAHMQLIPDGVISGESLPVPVPGMLKDNVMFTRLMDLMKALDAGIAELADQIDKTKNGTDTLLKTDRLPLLPRGADSPLPESVQSQPVSATGIPAVLPSIPSLLDALESLQLLARPTPLHDGTQQLISLPIKFGEHISEMTVQFKNHAKKGKNSGSSSHFSAVINVVPPFLGHINSHLDYRRSKQLNITMSFERKISYRWFTHHKLEIAAALQPAFMHPVRVEFGMQKDNSKESEIVKSASDRLIDVKA